MQRLEDWDTRLFTEVERAGSTPFKYGDHDCALLASRLIHAMTGRDIAAEVRGTYSTPLGALRCLKRTYGVDDLAELADQYFPSIPVALAGRGDLVLLTTADIPTGALGIVVGDKAIFPGPEKCSFVPVSGCTRAWRV